MGYKHKQWFSLTAATHMYPRRTIVPVVSMLVAVAAVMFLSTVVSTTRLKTRQNCTLCSRNRVQPWFVECEIEDVACFVSMALRPWKDVPITKAKIERVWEGRTRGEYCQLVQIIDGRVLLFASRGSPLGNEPWRMEAYQKRIDAVVQVIRLAVSMVDPPLKDTELTFCLGDCVASSDPRRPMVLPETKHDADFSVVKCQGSSAIPIPWFDVFRPPNDVGLLDWDKATHDIKANRDAHPWHTRKAQVVYRGGSERTCTPDADPEGYSSTTPVNEQPWTKECGRPKAVSLVRNDSRFSFEGPHLGMPDHENYKYVMYIHGHCHWANRLRRLLFMGMALFKQVGVCEEFYALRLQPWVHYIPVDYHFQNLTVAVQWAMTHEGDVVAMVNRMHEYAEKYNTAEFALQYTAELLRQYAQLLDYTVQPRPGAHQVITSEG